MAPRPFFSSRRKKYRDRKADQAGVGGGDHHGGGVCGRKLVWKGQTHSPATSSVTERASGGPCSPLHPLLVSANPEKRT